MELWQIIISIAAGLITLSTFIEKIGKAVQNVKKADNYMDEVRSLPGKIEALTYQFAETNRISGLMSEALKSILRNELYICFKDHREIGACTDDEFRVQTALHHAYTRLGGNGEEAVWWEKKIQWKIVTDDEFERLYVKHMENQTRNSK